MAEAVTMVSSELSCDGKEMTLHCRNFQSSCRHAERSGTTESNLPDWSLRTRVDAITLVLRPIIATTC